MYISFHSPSTVCDSIHHTKLRTFHSPARGALLSRAVYNQHILAFNIHQVDELFPGRWKKFSSSHLFHNYARQFMLWEQQKILSVINFFMIARAQNVNIIIKSLSGFPITIWAQFAKDLGEGRRKCLQYYYWVAPS